MITHHFINILDSQLAPALQAKEVELKKAQIADSLDKQLSNRLSTGELELAGVLRGTLLFIRLKPTDSYTFGKDWTQFTISNV